MNAMPTSLYLVRHGETEWSLSGQHTSITDLPLTEHGEQQARALHRRLNLQDFQLILSSPRGRARRTAELAGFDGPYEPEVDRDLAEWFYGDDEGRTSKEIWQMHPGWTIWSGDVPGGESTTQVAGRLDRVISRVRESGVERAICFGHGLHSEHGRCAGSACTCTWACTFRWIPALRRCSVNIGQPARAAERLAVDRTSSVIPARI